MTFRAGRAIRWILAVLIGFIAIQFVNRPSYVNPPVTPAHSLLTRAPADVRAILDRSCRDCHTNDTRWPLYSRVAPMSWLVAGHVQHGRDRINFSEWTSYDSDEQDKFLGGMCSQTKRGRMPLPSYLWIHRSAKLSQSDISVVCAWSDRMRDTLQ
jgi:hypothetical protein